MLVTYYRGQTILNAQFPRGAMAAVGMTWQEAATSLPPGVFAACHNGHESVSISGEQQKVLDVVELLKNEGKFAKVVDSSGIAFHSPCMELIKHKLLEKFATVSFILY